jgi:hypothetical protein
MLALNSKNEDEMTCLDDPVEMEMEEWQRGGDEVVRSSRRQMEPRSVS